MTLERAPCVALVLACAGCVGIPADTRSLAAGFAREDFTLYGACRSSWSDDGVLTLKDGPGALVIALAEPDYRVHVEADVEPGGNSGVFVRSKGGIWFPDGVEVQIDPADPVNPTGSLYGRARSRAPIPPAGTWFTIDIDARGSRVAAAIDGVPSASIDDAPADGPLFGLQAHYPGSVVRFRGLVIEPVR